MDFFRADTTHLDSVVTLAALLWTDHDSFECREHFAKTLSMRDCPIFVCMDDGKAIGFGEFSLRHDYVEGTQVRPVGYVEGIFVREEYRKAGIGKRLIELGEQWAKEMGCTQMASDCELANTRSLAFHLGCGFSEANRIICFIKDIGASQNINTPN